jgi:uncharacterized protein (DUF58 family)
MAHEIPLLPAFIARFIERWAVKRLPETNIKTTINRHRLYILPTRNGIIFLVVLLVILIGAINYENSLSFMLTFLLVSIGFLSMIHTHQNLNHLNITTLPTKAVFAGQTALFPLRLQSKNNHEHLSILFPGNRKTPCCANLDNDQQETLINLPVNTAKRGYLPMERTKIYTEFPLGLFHAWSWINLDASCLIYPEPDKQALKFEYSGQSKGLLSTKKTGADDFAGIREYQKGDPPKHLAWKAIAKTGELQTKHFHAETGNEIWLSWNSLPEKLDVEKRLSILCRWVIDAEKKGIKYGLNIPGTKISPKSGQLHRHACLKSLALFGNA